MCGLLLDLIPALHSINMHAFGAIFGASCGMVIEGAERGLVKL
jgi:hypothetical protein